MSSHETKFTTKPSNPTINTRSNPAMSSLKAFTRKVSGDLAKAYRNEKENNFMGTRTAVKTATLAVGVPLVMMVVSRKLHLQSAEMIGAPKDIEVLRKEYEMAVSIPAKARNDLAKKFIRRSRIIDWSFVAAELAYHAWFQSRRF